MEQDIWERQKQETDAHLNESLKKFNQLNEDEDTIRKALGYSDSRMPDKIKEKLERDRQAWADEWGVKGWRAVEMQSRHEVEQKAELARINKSQHKFTAPPFMDDAFDKCDAEGQVHLVKLANQYQDEKAMFLQTTYLQKLAFQRDWNKLVNERKSLTVEDALRPIQDKYKEKADEIAKQYSVDSPVATSNLQNAEETVKSKFASNVVAFNRKQRKRGMRF